MGLFRSSRPALSDADLAESLARAVQLITPMVSVLADVDLFGLKARTHRSDSGDSVVDRGLDAAAWVLNVAHLPGTRAWANMDVRHRVNWWVRRVGAFNTAFVASPRSLGVLSTMLPVQDLLGFANQAVVVCAVAREHGVTEPGDQVRLLGQVLCNRTLDDTAVAAAVADHVEEQPQSGLRNPIAMTKELWHLAGVLREIRGELNNRPHPRGIFRRLSVLPGVGGIAGYLGEYGALRRAGKAAVAQLGQRAADRAAEVDAADQGSEVEAADRAPENGAAARVPEVDTADQGSARSAAASPAAPAQPEPVGP